MSNHFLSILDVIDRGVPNQERIPIRVEMACTLTNFWIGLGLRQEQDRIFPINDNLFWLGNGFVNSGDWIFVYSGNGVPKINEIPGQSNKIYTLHWNRENTLFSSKEIYPYLLHANMSTPPSFSVPDYAQLFAQFLGKENQDNN